MLDGTFPEPAPEQVRVEIVGRSPDSSASDLISRAFPVSQWHGRDFVAAYSSGAVRGFNPLPY